MRSARSLAVCATLMGCSDWAGLRARIDRAAPQDAAVDALASDAQQGQDASSMTDATPDGGVCPASCVAPSDRVECGSCAVRLLAPSSGRAIGSSQMTVRWDSGGFSSGQVRFELSATRSFGAIAFTQRAPRLAGQMQVETPLLVDGRRYFWRLVAVTDDRRDGAASTAWHVFVDAAGAAMNVELPPRWALAGSETPLALAGAPLANGGLGAAYSIQRAARSVDFVVSPIAAPTAFEPDANYGRAIAVIGDVDGDGYVEHAVSSARLSPDPDGMFSPGTVWVFDGAARRPPVAIRRGLIRDSFGVALTAAGDLDGDGYADFAIGAPGRRESMSAACEVGFASVQFGSASFFEGARPALVELTPESNGGRTRTGIAVLGGYDFDGEPGDDLAIAAPAYGDNPCGVVSSDRSGRVYVYRGGSRALSQPYVLSAASRGELIGRLGYAMAVARPRTQARPQLVIAAIALQPCTGSERCRVDVHQGITLYQARDFRTTPTLNAALVRIGTLHESVDGSGEQTRFVAMDVDRDGEVEFVLSNPQSASTGLIWHKEIGPWPTADASLLTNPMQVALSTPADARRGASLAAMPSSEGIAPMLFVGTAGSIIGESPSLHVLFWTGMTFEAASLDAPMGERWTGVTLPSW